MWSQILLCLSVGLAFASENPAWNEQNQYVYDIHARSFASLNQISSHYSGIVIKAKLHVKPRSDGNLGARIADAEYAKVHEQLYDGWDAEIPESELHFEKLSLSEKAFHIVMTKGAARNIIVNKQIKNWEANMIKSIASQLQLDTKATNLIPSTINILTQDETNSAVFKTVEETVTGVSETLYEIHPFPEYVLQSKPWILPHRNLGEQGDVIEVLKGKNFTHSPQAPSYHQGLEGIGDFKPENQIGKFLSRNSVTRAVITGSLKKFTIHSAVTTEEIAVSPLLAEQEMGSVNSMINLTLSTISKASDDSKFEVDNPVEVGLVYGYNSPYSTDNSPRPAKEYDHGVAPSSAESQSSKGNLFVRREPYAADSMEEEDWHQDKPQLGEAPPTPLLPFTVGHDGQSIKKQKNIVETVRTLAEEIGQEFPHPQANYRQQTASKFVVLTSLVRIMNQNELKEVAKDLHRPSDAFSGEPSPAWTALSESFAQAGTGPALINIEEWIRSGKVTDSEAAHLISTAAAVAREPTEEYMRFFNEKIIQNDAVMSRPHLNESALMSYTTLVRHVYSNQQESRGTYPVYTYGSFRTARGEKYVKDNVIPYLTTKLKEAINNADTRKIHVYIRALGNIGRQEILEAFEPYLEGQKKASHLQRVLMIAALNQLVRSNPRVARSVLYKIYQNPAELEPVRIAAVYQLARTRPSATMLQRMATYTNVDRSSYVNAVVKSVIESLSKLRAPEHENLRAAADSARPLLTSEEFGIQYGKNYLRSFVEEELEAAYQQQLNAYGSEDHVIPRGINYVFERQLGGVEQSVVNIEAYVSTIEDLVNVFDQQTKEYKRQQKEKQDQNAHKLPWSSEYVAKLLNLQNEQREQLEGNFYFQVGALESIMSFDNHTFNNISQVTKELEEALRAGKKYTHYRMMNEKESTLAVPTVLGLPFVYAYDRPLLVHSKMTLKASAKPQISDGHLLQRPDIVEAEFDLNAAVSGRIQSEFGIFTPFDHQRYSAGYSKQYQVVIPLNGKLTLYVQKGQMKLEVNNPGSQENVRLVHYSTWPYTSQNDVLAPKPTLRIIRSSDPFKKNIVVGDKSTGVAVNLEIVSDSRIDLASVYERFSQGGLASVFVEPLPKNTQYLHVDVGIDSSKSTTDQVILQVGYQRAYKENDPNAKKPDPNEKVNDIPAFAEDRERRQKEFVTKLGSYLNNAEVVVGDATVEMVGKSKIKYSVTAGASKSNVDPTGAFMALVRKLEGSQAHILAYVQAGSKTPNTNGLNLDYAMKMDPTSVANVQGLLRRQQSLSRADAKITVSQSKERLAYLKEQDDYQECQRQMKQEGNTQLPVCAKMTIEANRLDKFSMEVTYNNMDAHIVNATYQAYSAVRQQLYPRVEEDIIADGPKDHLEVRGQFSPDLRALNVSIASEYGNAEIRNVPLSKYASQLLVPHPVFHVRARLAGKLLEEDSYRPTCVIDKSAINTFDNKTYPASGLSTSWTVALQYVPRRPSPDPNKPHQTVPEQLREAVESYIVYTRAAQAGSSQKEIQIVLQMPSTQGKVVRIIMKPNVSDRPPRVFVNDQEVKYTSDSSSDYYGGHIQIYSLPNREVKMEIRHAFYIIFNGQTFKITTSNSKFRDSSRGLCGTFTGEPETDFSGPDNCIIRNPEKFIQSYTVEGRPRPIYNQQSSRQKCYQKKVVYADYISNKDAGRASGYSRRSGVEDCTGHISRYEEKDGQICFTIRPLPYCKPRCRPIHTNTKQIDVYCVHPSPSALLWKAQLDKNIHVDFTTLEPTGKLPMAVPARCVP